MIMVYSFLVIVLSGSLNAVESSLRLIPQQMDAPTRDRIVVPQ